MRSRFSVFSPGYTAAHLSELIRQGRIPNAGRIGAPRIRRADLSIKTTNKGRPRKNVPENEPNSIPRKPDDRIQRLTNKLR